MDLLDTNVVSELRKAKAGKVNRSVRTWANGVSASTLFLSAISILELEIGILLIERRDRSQGAILRSWMEDHVLPTFYGRILPSIPLSRRDVRPCMSQFPALIETPRSPRQPWFMAWPL
jgi:hypothetical protein